MHLTLVDNFVMPDGLEPSLFDLHPHLGLISLAAAVEREGHDVSIYDPKREVRLGRHAYDEALYDRAAEDIASLRPDVIGFTTLGCSFLFAVMVARRLKQRDSRVPILLGGPHATMLYRRILEMYPQFDVVVRHEAEETLPAVLAHLPTRSFHSVPGVAWRDQCGSEIVVTEGLPRIDDLDSLPLPAYDKYPIRDLGLDLMRVEAGRGCPFACTFCSTSSFFQRIYRLKSPERLVLEMDLIHARYGVSEFKLDHDLFTVNRRKVEAFCEAVQDRNYSWRVSARTDCVDEPLLRKMARAGCVGLYCGLETGSERMQQISQKRLKLNSVDRILNVAQELGIETTVSFITGYPEERGEDQARTLDELGRCFRRPEESCIPQLHILLPEPGTPMFEKHGHSLAYDGYVTKFNARLLSEADLGEILAFPDLYSTYYYYPTELERSYHTFAVDAVDALRAAGHTVLSYALLFWENRLSDLIAAFREWASRSQHGVKVDASLAIAFIVDKFGPGHHLTSLFRFGVGIHGARAANTLPDGGSHGNALRSAAQAYRLGPCARVFPELHDCLALMRRIRERPSDAGPLDDDEVGPRMCCVAVTEGNRTTTYHVTSGAESVLSLFEIPRRLDEVSELLHEIEPTWSGGDVFFDELIKMGVLVPAAHGVAQVAAEC